MERLAEAIIVPAGPGDAAALAEVHVRSWRETYPGLLPETYLQRMSPRLYARRWRRQLSHAHAGQVVLAAETTRGLVGYCAGAVAEDGRNGEVFTLYVIGTAQGAGLGARLLRNAGRVLQAQGARALKVWVLNGNARACGFYDHLGGVPVDERDVSGWGGGLRETLYRWSDLGVLTRV
jgi:GNAT superfamily N-acetyltransferase